MVREPTVYLGEKGLLAFDGSAIMDIPNNVLPPNNKSKGFISFLIVESARLAWGDMSYERLSPPSFCLDGSQLRTVADK